MFCSALFKLSIIYVSAVSCILALVLFGIDMDAKRLGENVGYNVRRAWSFYVMVRFNRWFTVSDLLKRGLNVCHDSCIYQQNNSSDSLLIYHVVIIALRSLIHC